MYVVVLFRKNKDGIMKVIGPLSYEVARSLSRGYQEHGYESTFTDLIGPWN